MIPETPETPEIISGKFTDSYSGNSGISLEYRNTGIPQNRTQINPLK